MSTSAHLYTITVPTEHLAAMRDAAQTATDSMRDRMGESYNDEPENEKERISYMRELVDVLEEVGEIHAAAEAAEKGEIGPGMAASPATWRWVLTRGLWYGPEELYNACDSIARDSSPEHIDECLRMARRVTWFLEQLRDLETSTREKVEA